MVEIRELSSKREVIAEKRETGIDDNKRDVSGQDGTVGMSAFSL